ncbi:MAG TPA: NTP transferase domain-containing protein, partial [Mycobacterium sp.]
MTSQGESAVLVLAAGAGTRMRSDTPKVLHPLAGRTMLAHSLHAIAKMAPQHLVVVLGQDYGQIEQVVAELAGTLGRSIDTAIQDRQLGTGHAVLCGLSALPDEFAGVVVVTSGDVPLLDADTLTDLVAVHNSRSAAVTMLTTTLTDPTGYGRTLRTQDHEVIGIVEQADATPSQQEIREVN